MLSEFPALELECGGGGGRGDDRGAAALVDPPAVHGCTTATASVSASVFTNLAYVSLSHSPPSSYEDVRKVPFAHITCTSRCKDSNNTRE